MPYLISDLLWFAWRELYDVAVIVSGDRDLVPSLERVQLSGRRVVVGLFDGTSAEVRRASYSSFSLDEVLADCDIYPPSGLVRRLVGISQLPVLRLDLAKFMPLLLREGRDLDSFEAALTSDLIRYSWGPPEKQVVKGEDEAGLDPQQLAKSHIAKFLSELRELIRNS